MAPVKTRIFLDKTYTYLLRLDDKVFKEVKKISNKRKASVNTILNEAVKEYVEKEQA